MSSNTRFVLGLILAVSVGIALIMLIQIGFKAIGWIRIHSAWYGPLMEEFLLGAIIIAFLSGAILWKAGPMDSGANTERSPTAPHDAWVSNARSDGSLGRRLIFAEWEEDQTTALERMKRNQTAIPLTDDEVPRSFFEYAESEDDAPYTDNLGDLIVSGYVIVSDRMAAVLERFDLGGSRLMPLDAIYGRDRTTPLPGTYALFNFGEEKSAFAPEATNPAAARQVAKGVPIWTLDVTDAEDGDIALTEAATKGADFWIDPATPLSFYLSDRLMTALRDAGLAWPWDAKRCQIVTP